MFAHDKEPAGTHLAAPAASHPGDRRLLAPFLLVLCLVAAGQAFLLANKVPRVISDGYGYWSYLPSYVILHDPSLSEFMARYEGTPMAQGMYRAPDGTFFQKYPVGVAVMELPFFLAADVVSRYSDFPRDGYSPPYQVAAATGAAVYALLGLALLVSAFASWYPEAVRAWAAVFLLLGTNAYHYATFDGSFSHIHSFFLASALIRLMARGWKGGPLDQLVCGAVLGLMALVRPTNALYLLFFALWAFWRGLGGSDAPGRQDLGRACSQVAACGLVAGAVFLVQPAVWHASTGHWLIYPYPGEYFEFSSPHVADVLFSVRKGLFFWHPLYLVALAGLFLARLPAGYRAAALLFLAAHLYVTSSWYCWWYGGTLGQRPFVDVLPVLYPGLAGLMAFRTRAVRLCTVALCAALTVLSLYCTVFYWLGVIPPDRAGLEHLELAWRLTRAWVLKGLTL